VDAIDLEVLSSLFFYICLASVAKAMIRNKTVTSPNCASTFAKKWKAFLAKLEQERELQQNALHDANSML